ncbi:glycosyltransferase family 2 protein [Mucilaginibacter gotjawali]|uniref:N-acetylglucosaminyl-diphospho-decaprenol L-rhamnosyltransferase n=2 Tax=Mucilaginibacter gotjawali TaxID=1550579 RepID=A0A0X8X309_9SPHI|nr:glycosyltransferase family 2 protein [Mucilaginibacter gotjawali]MBB3053934.1 GT2 family glycosyltransferase [Mucilaginibacter gotjawali]BAU54198.1 N-acetylglucosaminyl-diphospho-decaprenol L-rhamnosyltransferase [Mucilaginibacter gotjawali]
MKLSVIVVNNNAGTLLRQALNSLIYACKNIDYELIIVDDASTDHSMELLQDQYPDITLICNKASQGTGRANNQAIDRASGEYILLVSADTICGKDSLQKACAFMDEHPDTGGLSVRMLSPQGRFLPESIHGLDKTWATFLRLIGFARHLSKTRLYDRNRKDWVEEFQISEIDILSSDFMLLRRSALNEAGLFDERFLMYGHNIDLSYRIRLAGFKNYYFPKTYIINYERQQIPKFSWSYIKYFYGAMIIFAVKYLIRLPQIKVDGIPALFQHSYEVKG